MKIRFSKTKIIRRAVNFCSFFCFLVFLTFQVNAAWQEIGNVTKIAETKINGVILETTSGAKASIEFFDLNVIRVRIAPNGEFEREFSYAFDPLMERETPSVKVSQTTSEIILINSNGAKVAIQKTPFSIKVLDKTGEIVVQDDAKNPTSFNKETGEIKTSNLRRSEVENYYGFGEKAFSEMSRIGKHIVNWNTDTFAYPIGTDPIYQSIPFSMLCATAKPTAYFSIILSAHISIWEKLRPKDTPSEQMAANSIILFSQAEAKELRKKY